MKYYVHSAKIKEKVQDGFGVLQYEAGLDALVVPPTIMLKGAPAPGKLTEMLSRKDKENKIEGVEEYVDNNT